MYKKFLKRMMDLILASIAILILLVPMVIISIITKLDSSGPAFFRQKRVGKNKEYFTILKFRSMPTTVPSDVPTHLSDSSGLLSKWQKFIRKSSLDELPQLFNILGGSMSFVGPRPALWNQYDLISERDLYGANDIKPGLTGWAQINGRDTVDIKEKAKLDGEYVKRMSFVFDMKCLIYTVVSVLKADGVVEGGSKEKGR